MSKKHNPFHKTKELDTCEYAWDKYVHESINCIFVSENLKVLLVRKNRHFEMYERQKLFYQDSKF